MRAAKVLRAVSVQAESEAIGGGGARGAGTRSPGRMQAKVAGDRKYPDRECTARGLEEAKQSAALRHAEIVRSPKAE